jgi:hypothetical protein
LYETNSYNDIEESVVGILKTNGDLVVNLTEAEIGEQYYIVIKHRNSIATWSKNPILLTPNVIYNFDN